MDTGHTLIFHGNVSNPSQALTQLLVRQLQLIQNSAARVVTKTKKRHQTPPDLRSLQRPLVPDLMVDKSLNGRGPKRLCDLLTQYEP